MPTYTPVVDATGTGTEEPRQRATIWTSRLPEYEPNNPVPLPRHGEQPDDPEPRAPEHTTRPSGRGPDEPELHRLLRTLLEVLDGHRSPVQLRRLLSSRCYEALCTRISALGATPPVVAPRKLRRVYTCRPTANTIELCATFQHGTRVRAAAARVETTRSGWRCTVFRVI